MNAESARAIRFENPLPQAGKTPFGGLSVACVGPHFVTPRGFRRLQGVFPSDARVGLLQGFSMRMARTDLQVHE